MKVFFLSPARIFALGLICGIAITSTCLITIYKSFAPVEEKYKHGVNVGYVQGIFYSIEALKKEFGEVDFKEDQIKNQKYKILYSMKTSNVVSIEINGIKTVRIIP